MHSKKILLLIFFFIFFPKNIFAKNISSINYTNISCYNELSPAEVDGLVIENLTVKFSKNKKWVTNLFNIHKEFEIKKNKSEHKNWFSNFRIDKKFKKKFSANILVKFKDYKECKFKAKVRVTGDLWWHLNWKKGAPISSVHIKLLDGNLYNVTQFKLFLKEARNGINEVFVSNLFKELGFISPKTFLLNAKINNVDHEYIFQEDIRKELLESSFYREGPLLEGDERYTVSLTDKEQANFPVVSFAKVVNANFLRKNNSNSVAGLEALSNMNRLYLYNHDYKLNKTELVTSDDLYLFTNRFFSEKNSKILNTYESLAYALDIEHGLSMDDRRFYYDTFNNFYIPIYYDGKSKILEKEQIKKLLHIDDGIPNEAILGAPSALNKIKNLDLDNFVVILNKSGVDISKDELTKIINKINMRIELIEAKSKTEEATNLKHEFFKRNHTKEQSIKFILSNYKDKQFFICDFKLENCEVINVREPEFSNILNEASRQRFNILKTIIDSNDHMVFLFENSNDNYKNFNFFNSWQTSDTLGSVKILSKNIKISIDEANKKITITQLKDDGKILFLDGKLNEWNIEFNAKIDKNYDLKNNFDNLNNLTGCLSFYEVEFNLVNIISNNSRCEDSVNIVRSKGNINLIEIVNSSSDALDVDFSNLLINKIKITSALNDCVDFSSGIYNLGQLNLKNCGDKALSVGEKSTIELKEIIVDGASMGLASKDSSTVKIQNATLKNLKICLSAYQKKQEYNGGFIFVDNIKCENYNKKVDVDKNSKIFLKKKLLKNNELDNS
jgi:hypothetical protein